MSARNVTAQNVPPNWDVRRLKSICSLAYGDSLPDAERSNGEIPVYGSNGKIGTHFVSNTDGPSIVIGRKGSFGKVHFSEQPAFAIDTTYFVDRNYTHADLRWLFYLLASSGLDTVSRDSAIPGLNRDDAYRMAYPYPPPEEQAAIVRYLDHADELINRYTSTKERLIDLLEEQRQAVIHQVVTRGLDPDVKMKDSQVEWLGEVPERWEVRRIKSLTAVKRGASPRPIDDSKYFSNCGEYAWVRIADVTASNHFLETTTQRLSKLGQSLSVQLEPGALFMSIAGSVGKPMITKIKCCIHDGFVYFPDLEGDQAFMYQTLSTSFPFIGLGKFGTQLNLNTETVGGIRVPFPPISERRQITAFLEDSSANFEKTISQAQHQIHLINEYRARLIADVVTGQIDVRNATVELPD